MEIAEADRFRVGDACLARRALSARGRSLIATDRYFRRKATSRGPLRVIER